MKASVVLVEPEKAVNLGLIARLVDNFEIERLILVNPQLTTSQLEVAKILASHSARRIDSAIQVDFLEEALSEADLTVATSARGNQQGRNILRRSLNLRELQDHLPGLFCGHLSLVFGRDGTGLTREEIELCDLLVNIGCSPSNPVLNLACAVSIVLHEVHANFEQTEGPSPILPSRDLRERLVRE
ncbi:MAG: RNA methyltransferase, partial [Candidatus Geothermarchaeales archaeon]